MLSRQTDCRIAVEQAGDSENLVTARIVDRGHRITPMPAPLTPFSELQRLSQIVVAGCEESRRGGHVKRDPRLRAIPARPNAEAAVAVHVAPQEMPHQVAPQRRPFERASLPRADAMDVEVARHGFRPDSQIRGPSAIGDRMARTQGPPEAVEMPGVSCAEANSDATLIYTPVGGEESEPIGPVLIVDPGEEPPIPGPYRPAPDIPAPGHGPPDQRPMDRVPRDLVRRGKGRDGHSSLVPRADRHCLAVRQGFSHRLILPYP
jgi:hypothetical protein